MSDSRNVLQSMFQEASRYANFGDMLIRMHIRGLRCHSGTVIEISSPITAFCGLNGTGKSTILQLAAAGYRNPNPGLVPWYIKDFLVVGTLDPEPFKKDATVEYKFWQGDRSLRTVTISRSDLSKRWSGYSRRPLRNVFFAGVGSYLPKIEKRDFMLRNASRLTISATTPVIDRIKQNICRVLGCGYDTISSNMVTHFHQTGKIVTVNRVGTSYSEAHMGYGEGRSQYLISAIETLPEKSLVLIEEPETSLHPSAQHEFGKYLVDVAIERRHQILITTHSEFILEALPSQSRVYLNRSQQGIDPIIGLTALQAKSLMAHGHVKALHVLVEDDCAKAVLSEMIRVVDPNFLTTIGIYTGGDRDVIAKTVRTLQVTQLPLVAVRDGDQGDSPSENIFKLPGNEPPEKDLFASEQVRKYFETTYGISLKDFLASIPDTDHHDWFRQLADRVSQNEAVLVSEAARAYIKGLNEIEVTTLITLLKEASRK